jgi:hypothetical protein
MALAIIISLVTGALAARKGYNFFIWALAAGIPSLVILSFMPFSNKENQSAEERAHKKRTGNTVGGVLAVIGLIIMIGGLVSN